MKSDKYLIVKFVTRLFDETIVRVDFLRDRDFNLIEFNSWSEANDYLFKKYTFETTGAFNNLSIACNGSSISYQDDTYFYTIKIIEL